MNQNQTKSLSIAVIGGGITGLTLAYLLKQKGEEEKRPLKLMLFEEKPFVGGVIQSTRRSGFLCEAGPNGFLDNEPTTLALIDKLQMKDRLLSSSDKSRFRFVVKNKKLVQLPTGLLSFIESPLLQPWSKLRLLLEPFIPAGRAEDETIAAFGRRRLGKEVATNLLDPMVTGIYAGDINELSMAASFPKMATLEAKYGGLVKGMIQQQKEKSAEKSAEKSKKSSRSTLYSFQEGMVELPNRLKEVLSEEIQLEEKVIACKIEKEQSLLKTSKKSYQFDYVFFTLPSYAAAPLLQEQFPDIAASLGDISYAPVISVCHGYSQTSRSKPLVGFGHLIPSREKCETLGTLWSSSIFPNRAPKEKFLLRTLVGGAHHLEVLQQSNTVEQAMKETQQLLKIKSPACFQHHNIWEKGIAQYQLGHLKKIQQIEAWEKEQELFYLAGSAYRGVSINSCIKDAFESVDKIWKVISSKEVQ